MGSKTAVDPINFECMGKKKKTVHNISKDLILCSSKESQISLELHEGELMIK